MPWGIAAIGAVGSIASGVIGANAATSAAQTQANAANQASQVEQNMFNTTQANLAPWMTSGATANNALMQLLGLAPSPGSGITAGGQPVTASAGLECCHRPCRSRR